jgi:phage baseplate assembly protein W
MAKRDITFRSVGVQQGDPGLEKEINIRGFGIKTPIEIGTGRSGIFEMHFNAVSQAEDNLRNLILTNHGERLGNHGYGANLRTLTTEVSSIDDFDTIAMERIRNAVTKHMPFVELSSFSSDFGGTSGASAGPSDGVPAGMTRINMRIKYRIPQLRSPERAIEISMYCVG